MMNRHSKNVSYFLRLSFRFMNNWSSKPSLFLKVRCSSASSSDQSQSFTISYLQNKLGFSPESALVVSKYVDFQTPEKPDSVIAFLDKHGFSKTQIKRLVKIRPFLLRSSAEKILLPKLEFFQSKGVSSPQLTKLLFYNPHILGFSLEKRISPCFNQLSNLLQSDSKAIKAVMRCPYLFSHKLGACVLPNIQILLYNGVPESNIPAAFVYHPRSFIISPGQFKEIVKEVKEMGFNPLLPKFLNAVVTFRQVSKLAMQRKLTVYKKWGWSEEQIWEAFKKDLCVMSASEEKIEGIMDYLVNKMGFQSFVIANHPYVLRRSLDKRIVPRGLFAQDLLSKGLIKKFDLSALFHTSEEVFIQRFIKKYEDKEPKLLALYKEKLNLAAGGKYRSRYS